MKRLATIIAALTIMTMANVASAYEWTPGQICQATDGSTVTYSWTQIYAGSNGAYVICPIPRTYACASQAIAYVNNPSGSSTWGYINFVSTDLSYTNFNSASTAAAGYTPITFASLNCGGYNGFINFEMNEPANGGIVGFFSN